MQNLSSLRLITILGFCLAFINACGRPDATSNLFGAAKSADYKMNRGRTSKIIKSASAYLKIAGECDDEDGEEGWVLYYKWKAKTLLKTFEGDGDECVGKVYFTDEFRETLRTEGSYKHSKATITHNDYDGRCDYVTFTDLDSLRFEGAKVKARICDGVPVIHAETFDVKGKFDGTVAKLGMDWKR